MPFASMKDAVNLHELFVPGVRLFMGPRAFLSVRPTPREEFSQG